MQAQERAASEASKGVVAAFPGGRILARIGTGSDSGLLPRRRFEGGEVCLNLSWVRLLVLRTRVCLVTPHDLKPEARQLLR